MNYKKFDFINLLRVALLFLILSVSLCSFHSNAAVTCKSVISYPGTTKATVNMRKKAGTKYKSLGMVDKGENVKILGYVKTRGITWYKCKATLQSGSTKTGYISSLYVKKVSKPKGVVNGKVTSTLNVRKSAKTTAKSLLKIPKKTETTVLGIKKNSGDYWYKVKVSYSGKTKTGYVLGSYIDINVEEKKKQESEYPKEAYVNDKITSYLNVRKKASTDSSIVSRIPKGTVVSVTGIKGNWYKINLTYESKNISGYVAKEYITFGKPNTKDEGKKEEKNNNTSLNVDTDFNKQLAAFPESYKASIVALKSTYPNWNFVAVNTGLDWNTAVTNESVVGRNLIQSNYPKGVASLAPLSYLSTAAGAYDSSKKKYTVFDGYNWYSAAPEVIAYYMDPRNFLNDVDIFQFEALAYDESQSSTVVESILKNTFMSGNYSVTDTAMGQVVTGSYVQAFMDAGKASGANPYFLAARSKQEVGAKGSNATSGLYKGYEGIYNYYNIGASDGSDAVAKGLLWAKGGSANATTYNRPWTNPYKSITGGASYIAQNYIAKGQDTLYFQKFNVHPKDSKQTYSHQYMTNVQAPWAEGRTTRAAYNDLGILSDTMVFYIPVYNNMTEKACALPEAK
ncbi:MAG: SH3 domain-containing protein [Lachnospiraceae bacterium]|nr:SH3 domain-containing protein [Lachnospiraceae bacterium]